MVIKMDHPAQQLSLVEVLLEPLELLDILISQTLMDKSQ